MSTNARPRLHLAAEVLSKREALAILDKVHPDCDIADLPCLENHH